MKPLTLFAFYLVGGMLSFICFASSAQEEAQRKTTSEKDLRAILASEFEGYTITTEPKPASITILSKADDTIRVRLVGPEEIDLDGDPQQEFILGYEFSDKVSTPLKRDFIALYKREQNGTKMIRLFRVEMESSDKGEFDSVTLRDVTADGVPDICVRYRQANAGMRSWSWKEHYRIFNGRSPYKLIFECSAGDGWGDAKGNGEVRLSEIVLEESTKGGPHIIKMYSRKGKDRVNTKRIDESPKVFELIGNRYEEK